MIIILKWVGLITPIISLPDTQINKMVQETSTSSHQHGYAQCIHTEQEIWQAEVITFWLPRLHCELLYYNFLLNSNLFEKKETVDIDNTQLPLSGKHFLVKFPPVTGSKKKVPARKCSICNFTKQQLVYFNKKNLQLPIKYSSYGFTVCANVTLCITACFELFHKK